MGRTLSNASELTFSPPGAAVGAACELEFRENSQVTARPAPGLGAVTRESTVAMRVVRALVDAIEQAGVPRARILQAARLTNEHIGSAEARVPRQEAYRLCELAVELTRDPAFGLHWGERLTESSFAPITNLLVHATDWREGLTLLHQFSRLLCDELPYQLEENGDEVVLRCLPLVGESMVARRFLAEMVTVGFLTQIRLISAGARPERVSFDFPAPDYRAEYARVFQNVERFDQPYTGIVFTRALLDERSPYRDDDIREALHAMAEQRLMRIAHRTPYALRVREVLVREAWPHRTDMQSVAHALGLSVRSLRRRLADEGRPYGIILNEALAIVAKQLLRSDGRTIEEVSNAMGFADKSTFYRSFKRWTGMTPNAYRQTEREKG